MGERVDVAIVGGGHNALVAAAYLARAGLRTVVLEAQDSLGGAAVSARPFAGVDARLSRYSYLVSLLPDRVVADLGLRLELRSRRTASYTPVLRGSRHQGLLVESVEGEATRASFRALTGSDAEHDAWQEFYAGMASFAAAVAPTFTEPLPEADQVRTRVDPQVWADVVERPIGEAVQRRFVDDDVRGIVATDALISTVRSLHDPGLAQNRCLLYHLVGNGTGEWRVPVGGMGALSDELVRVARGAGAQLRTSSRVVDVGAFPDGCELTVAGQDQTYVLSAGHVLSGVGPAVLARLLGEPVQEPAEGGQLKINLLLRRLPRLRSGQDPAVAFAGTFHVGEGFAALEQAHAEAAAGELPRRPPGEVYCHTLTDPSILAPELVEQGYQTMTYFGLHMPPDVFAPDPSGRRDEAVRRALAVLDEHLAEPIADCLAVDADGRPCLEAKVPQDLEATLGMAGGHIFHGDLSWPWLADDEAADTPARRWGVATPYDRVLMCGAGARRGGGVSGIGGHNAALALLETPA
jgi:phytoene dehydrogenase-like protein